MPSQVKGASFTGIQPIGPCGIGLRWFERASPGVPPPHHLFTPTDPGVLLDDRRYLEHGAGPRRFAHLPHLPYATTKAFVAILPPLRKARSAQRLALRGYEARPKRRRLRPRLSSMAQPLVVTPRTSSTLASTSKRSPAALLTSAIIPSLRSVSKRRPRLPRLLGWRTKTAPLRRVYCPGGDLALLAPNYILGHAVRLIDMQPGGLDPIGFTRPSAKALAASKSLMAV